MLSPLSPLSPNQKRMIPCVPSLVFSYFCCKTNTLREPFLYITKRSVPISYCQTKKIKNHGCENHCWWFCQLVLFPTASCRFTHPMLGKEEKHNLLMWLCCVSYSLILDVKTSIKFDSRDLSAFPSRFAQCFKGKIESSSHTVLLL